MNSNSARLQHLHSYMRFHSSKGVASFHLSNNSSFNFQKFPETNGTAFSEISRKNKLARYTKMFSIFLTGNSIPLAFPPKNSQIEWSVFLEIQQFLDFLKLSQKIIIVVCLHFESFNFWLNRYGQCSLCRSPTVNYKVTYQEQ